MPKRIQRKRTKGWRMPENTIYVGRPTQWGNPFVVGKVYCSTREFFGHHNKLSAKEAVVSFKIWMEAENKEQGYYPMDMVALWGKDLACFCPLDQPCHADILLELINVGGKKLAPNGCHPHDTIKRIVTAQIRAMENQ